MSPRPFPWRYDYQEDGPRLDSVVMRPVVPLSIVGRDVVPSVFALVDSGSEHVLVAPWVARTAQLETSSDKTINLGIGGESVRVHFVDARLRLHPSDGEDHEYVEWQTEVGVVQHWKPTWPALCGQVGFFDRFTVTMNRHAQQLAVEDHDVFDRRFGMRYLLR
jgi:hypothetical protein